MAGTTPQAREVTKQHSLLVFGSSGLLGRHLTSWAMTEPGWSVTGTYLTNASAIPAAVPATQCDILDADAVSALAEKTSPSIIVNAAYKQSGDRALDICSTGAANIAQAASQARARLVHVSTDLVFDGLKGASYVETDPVSPVSDYGKAKVEAEAMVVDLHHDVAIIRTSIIYGEPNAPQEQLVTRAIGSENIAFFTNEWRSPVLARDLAAAIGALGASEHQGIIHLAGDGRLNRLDFARLLAAELGLDASRLAGRPQDPSLGPRPQDVSLDCTMSHAMGLRLPGATERLGQSTSDSS